MAHLSFEAGVHDYLQIAEHDLELGLAVLALSETVLKVLKHAQGSVPRCLHGQISTANIVVELPIGVFRRVAVVV
jgi:hypothetical protein